MSDREIPCVAFYDDGSPKGRCKLCQGGHFDCLECPDYVPDVKTYPQLVKTEFQYGNSKPAETEEEAFANWFRDEFAVKP